MQEQSNSSDALSGLSDQLMQPEDVNLPVGSVHIEEISIGPLPRPEILSGYDSIVPGSAGMIISNMMEESQHRRKMEELALHDASLYAKRGQLIGFVVSLFGMGIGFSIIYFSIATHNDLVSVGGIISGSVIGGVPLVSLVRSFLPNGKADKPES